MTKTLSETVEEARVSWQKDYGKCSMCNVGDIPDPSTGLHRGKHKCGNYETCPACHGALTSGEQCQSCYRIEP